ncbi:MAG: DNA-directed RNA polymerase subunit alpha [Candidatus Omnitrophica bacterium]|nr:DNA-directed RNA polymerase subunit alpha [Candidatus Omnitrophota bacterium]MBU4478481.1 DNA-directed RNA polymerase subunit alpha [Candidatus Omnitrophota bacterium]MCG2703782.1 DNA-directed RNA polymerase subunit alpha [Candidatus Omnitrophota bacterium]
MGARWKDFQMPRSIICDEATLTNTYGKFIAEPFERGYGITIGNILRRVLLSSIEGAAVTAIKTEEVLHEFSSVKGVGEDVSQIVLNLKRLVLKVHGSTPKTIYLKASKKEEVTAADLIVDETIEIINPDLHIATLAKDAQLNMELTVTKGRGYVLSERLKDENKTIGVIDMDAVFTPVTKVNFNVENARVGQITDYDRLILEIWTNGSIAPKDALLHAANIAQRHLDIFMKFGHIEEEEIKEEKPDVDEELLEKLKMNVSELDLSVRSANCLKEARLKSVGDLVQRSELEMLKYRNFGKKSLAEINVILQAMGLSFGMKTDDMLKKKG